MANDQTAHGDADQAQLTALSALGWTLGDAARAERLLALTGLSPSSLREGVEDFAMLAAVLQFLEAHEPDLIACAAALRCDPSDLVHSRVTLEAQTP
jgi:hypothetical protein